MAVRQYQDSQQVLQRGPAFSHKIGPADTGADIKEFRIDALDPQNGTVMESLSLQGTHLPHQPFVHPVSQQIQKYYYPGGQAIRTPTVQILGSMDEEVIVRGMLRATKIRDTDRRTEPLTISNILERFVKEGNVCRFTLGSWIKFGVLLEFMPEYHTDSWIDYTIKMTIIGDRNPITGEESTGDENAIARVFGTDEAQEPLQAIEEINAELLETKADLEQDGYIPQITVEPFSISAYLARLIEGTPTGDIVDFGETIFEAWKEIIGSVNSVTTSVVAFSEEIERTAVNIQNQILLLNSQISNLYRVQQNIFVGVARVGAGVGTFSRLLSWNTVGNIIDYSHKLQGHFGDLKRATEREQVQNYRTIYIIRASDTLQSISTRFYGSPDRWEEIASVNNIEIGAVLTPDSGLVIPN